MVAASAADSSPDKAIHKLADQVAPRWVATIAALEEPLEVEVETALPHAAKAGLGPQRIQTRDEWILPRRVACLKGLQMREYKARCGWRFGAIPTVVVGVKSPSVRHWEVVCRRCARAKQEALEAETLAQKKER